MASVTNNDEKIMAADVIVPGEDEPEDRKPEQPERVAPSGGGFFTIYKKGQGYWTRLCTAGAAVLLVALTAQFLYTTVPPYIQWLNDHPKWLMGIVSGFALLTSLWFWRLMNKSTNVDFLIATDSEMKKVNWTSRQELVGSTKVVIFFMLIIAVSLFGLDVLFGYVFYFLGVLKNPPL
jgi:preprotein translocase SecE subunit